MQKNPFDNELTGSNNIEQIQNENSSKFSENRGMEFSQNNNIGINSIQFDNIPESNTIVTESEFRNNNKIGNINNDQNNKELKDNNNNQDLFLNIPESSTIIHESKTENNNNVENLNNEQNKNE